MAISVAMTRRSASCTVSSKSATLPAAMNSSVVVVGGVGVVVGLIVSLVVGLVVGLVAGPVVDLIAGLVVGLAVRDANGPREGRAV